LVEEEIFAPVFRGDKTETLFCKGLNCSFHKKRNKK
jgi:hypothetical protein